MIVWLVCVGDIDGIGMRERLPTLPPATRSAHVTACRLHGRPIRRLWRVYPERHGAWPPVILDPLDEHLKCGEMYEDLARVHRNDCGIACLSPFRANRDASVQEFRKAPPHQLSVLDLEKTTVVSEKGLQVNIQSLACLSIWVSCGAIRLGAWKSLVKSGSQIPRTDALV